MCVRSGAVHRAVRVGAVLGGERVGGVGDLQQLLVLVLADVVHLEGGVGDPVLLAQPALQVAADRVAVAAGETRMCAESAGCPEVISQTCRSWISSTSGVSTRWSASMSGSTPAGAASRKIRPESRTSPMPARSISTTTISEAIASARLKPVVSMIAPATAVAMKA